MSELLTNTQPAESLSARIDFAQAAAARLRASPGTHEPSAGLRARIGRLPSELQASAVLLARQGFDACDALLQLFEEGQALARLQARLNRGEKLTEEEARQYVRGQAALARARAGLAPREELQAPAFQLARLGYDATAAIRQLHEQGQARAKADAGLPLTERESVALAFAKANDIRAAHGLPAVEMPAGLDLDRRAPALSKAEAAQAAEAARNAHARYGR